MLGGAWEERRANVSEAVRIGSQILRIASDYDTLDSRGSTGGDGDRHSAGSGGPVRSEVSRYLRRYPGSDGGQSEGQRNSSERPRTGHGAR